MKTFILKQKLKKKIEKKNVFVTQKCLYFSELATVAASSECVAVGECGLDFNRKTFLNKFSCKIILF